MKWYPGLSLEDIERTVILDALRFYSGNRTHTADSLGISLRTVTNKLAKYREQGIVIPEPEGSRQQQCQTSA